MKKQVVSFLCSVLILSSMLPASALAHSGRTDSSGGHNCSEKSKAKGLCTGYHYHNGGSSSSGSSSSSSSSSGSSSSSSSSSAAKAAPSAPAHKFLNLNFYYNDKQQKLNKKLVSLKDTTYVSVRDFSTIFGFGLETDQAEDIILKKDKKVIKIEHSSNKIYLDGSFTDVKAVKIEGSYYMPLRSAVRWGNAKIVSIDNSSLYVSSN